MLPLPLRLCLLVSIIMKGLKGTLTEQWGSWLEDAGPGGSVGGMVTLKYAQGKIMPELKKAGLNVPGWSTLQRAMTSGLEDLPTVDMKKHPGVLMCKFTHILNALWGPVIEFMDAVASGASPEWTKELALNHEVLCAEMAGVVLDADEALDVDKWAKHIKEVLYQLLSVAVPERLIKHEMGAAGVPFQVHATPANARHLLRSEWCRKLVGPALAKQVNRLILAEIAGAPVALFSEAELALKVRQDLVDTLEQKLKAEEDEEEVVERPLKMSRTSDAMKESMANKTKQVLYMLNNRVTQMRMKDTVVGAGELLQDLRFNDPASEGPEGSGSVGKALTKATSELVGRQALARHTFLLDGAVDRVTSEALALARETGCFHGVALATDESPPSQPRFRGLRFQITVFYLGVFKALKDWGSCADPPVKKTSVLADITHCPGKKGVDVGKIVEKQLARLGLNCFDVVGCTGDGGGENEGQQGVHAHFEDLNPGYVRRRCLPHLAWRTCDVAIRGSGLNYKALAAYLTEGVTWSRLSEIAIKPVAEGGLALFKDGTQALKDLFSKSPSAIVENRPETDLNFLKALEGKEHLLHRLALKDLEQRRLGAETQAAVLNLGNISHRIRRRILQEVLERCLFLYYWNGKHQNIACSTTWDELQQRASAIIQDLDISEHVITR